ncbi:MAG: bifunctional diguanylate cyclase/phosphodiesterase [Pseudomonadota bacterium]
MLSLWAVQQTANGLENAAITTLAIITISLTTLATSGTVLAFFAGSDEVIESVEKAALTDEPTGLYSATGIRHALGAYAQETLTSKLVDNTYLISIEFTGLRQVNDYFSDQTGDRVLLAISRRIKRIVGDAGPIARTTGGEFVILLNTSADLAEIQAAVNAIMRALNRPIKVNGLIHPAYCSCGVALVASPTAHFESVLRAANVARSNAAEAGLGNWALYHPEMGEIDTYHRWLKAELAGAIERNELTLVYQPQVDAKKGTVVGYEALLRWNHWRIGAIPPTDFIPVAEHSGLIYQLGEWVLRNACANMKHLPDDTTISVNVSSMQLEQPDFDVILQQILEDEDVDTERVELEITETMLTTNSRRIRERLDWVKSQNIKIAIDDFGTGYSNLSTLAEFQFDRLKIDKSFIDRLDDRRKFGPMVATIVNLAQTLGADTVAEGVETERQAVLVKAAGCTIIQGYYYGRPKPLNEVLAGNEIGDSLLEVDGEDAELAAEMAA